VRKNPARQNGRSEIKSELRKKSMLMILLNDCTYASFTVAVVALPFLVINFLKCRERNLSPTNNAKITVMPIKSISFFVIPIILAITFVSVAQSVGRSRVLKVLHFTSDETTVLVNGKVSKSQKEIIQALSV
jgi:hypothetical protein